MILFVMLFSSAFLSADVMKISKKTRFPELSFTNTLTADEQKYLGISRKRTFPFHDVKGSLIIIEIFNTYCTSCPRNVPVLNNALFSVERDQGLRDRVKIVAIAVGNTANEVREYKKIHKTRYPIVTDYSFSAHKALGTPRVPFTLFVKRDSSGRLFIHQTHSGLFEPPDSLFRTIRNLAV